MDNLQGTVFPTAPGSAFKRRTGALYSPHDRAIRTGLHGRGTSGDPRLCTGHDSWYCISNRVLCSLAPRVDRGAIEEVADTANAAHKRELGMVRKQPSPMGKFLWSQAYLALYSAIILLGLILL